MSSLFLLFISLLYLLSYSLSQSQSPPPLRGTFIDCGAKVNATVNGREWMADEGYVFAGTAKSVTTPGILPILSSVRSFPLQGNVNRKFCYVVPVIRGSKYMVRTTYFYGGVNGGNHLTPPVFYQIVDGMVWGLVNTTKDYEKGLSSYYEGVFVARGKSMSVCLAANSATDSDLFISALELVVLDNSLYNSTDFTKFGLGLIARHSFGYNGSMIRYPDDQFDRIWEGFGQNDRSTTSNNNVSVSGIWNLPPSKVFQTELATGQSDPIEIRWPAASLQEGWYYIALYFADDHVSSSRGSRAFNISINGITYYKDLKVTPEGAAVFSAQWGLSGITTITLTPGTNSRALINAGEVFLRMPLEGRTLVRDAMALEDLKRRLQNPPHDWNGDPCLPRQYPWTGIKCSEGPRIRVVSLNLTSMALSGSIPHSIARMTALSDIWLGNNSLSGPIPDLSSLKLLKTLHLEDNKLSSVIPSSLGNITGLRELYLQNNNLTGQIPRSLIGKPGLDIRVFGNPFLTQPHS